MADATTYSLTLFDGDRPLRTIRREVAWFPADSSPRANITRPFISAIDEHDGVLWVLIKRRNPKWTGTATKLKIGASPMQLPPLDELNEGVLEAIDPVSGALIDSRVVPGDILRFIRPGMLSQQVTLDSSGTPVLQIWKAVLKRR